MQSVAVRPEGEFGLALTCNCGWTERVESGSWLASTTQRKSSTEKGKARSRAIEMARSHIGRVHGGLNCLSRRFPGNVLEVSGVNEMLLKEPQFERFRRLVYGKTPHGDSVGLYVALALWGVAIVGAFLLAVDEDSTPEPHPDPFLWLMLSVLFLGWLPAAWFFHREDKQQLRRKQRIESVLDEIDFRQVDPRPVRSGYSGNDDYASKRQRDHRWYADHSELNWRDREQAQAWGMDADTYASNWLEHDKD